MNQDQFNMIISKIEEKAAEIEQEVLLQQKTIIFAILFQVAFLGVIFGTLLS